MARQPIMKLVSPNHRTPEQFATLIKEKWQDQVKSIIEVGLLLETAKEELAHGEWGKMVKDHLPFTRATAAKLMKVADDARLSNDAHARDLPASWNTLYVLTQLSSEAFDAALASGAIHPGMTRKDATALLPPKEKKAKKQKPPSQSTIPPIDRCTTHVRATIFAALQEMEPDERRELFEQIRADLDDLETKEGIR